MSLSALPELLLAWVKTQGTALLQGSKSEQASPFKVGVQYEGKVLDQLSTGRSLVQVAGQKLDMGLPRSTQTGDTVRLTLLNAGPRPTFLLNQTPVSPVQQVQLSQTAQQVNTLMRLAQAPAQTGAQGNVQGALAGAAGSTLAAGPASLQGQVSASVSPAPSAKVSASNLPLPSVVPASPGSANKLVSVAASTSVAQVQASSSPATTQAATGARPIVANVVMLQGYTAASPTAPTAVASANTGLLGQAVDGLRAAIPASTTLKPGVVADVSTPSASLLPTRLAQTVRESGLFYEAHLARWTRGSYPFESLLSEPQARLERATMAMPGMAELGGMPEDAARLAGRQLHILEGGAFAWQGYAWPGQWMQWLVDERRGWQEEGQEGEGAGADQWHTELRLTLPRIGSVHAQLSLRGQDVSLRLTVADSAAAEALRSALPDLQKGLEASGLEPLSLLVESA